jgi:hypothetical protein
MEQTTDGKQRSSEHKGSNQDSHLEGESRGVGAIPAFGEQLRDYEIKASRDDSNGADTLSAGEWTGGSVFGKLVSQLIEENEKQLAYHKEQLDYHKGQLDYHEKQAQEAEGTLERLREIPQTLANIVHE